MRRVFLLGLLAAVTTLLGVLLSGLALPKRQPEVAMRPAQPATSPFGSDSIAPRELLQTPLRLSFSGTSLNDALRTVGGELPVYAAIEVDEIALRSLQIAAPTRIDLQAAERPASEWLRRIMRQADPDGRLCLTFTVNPDRTLSFLVTTQRAADERFLFVVPDRFLAAPPARKAAERFQPRRTTFAEALQYFAGRMGAHVRIDREALSSHGVWPERRIVLPAEFVSPECGLKEVLAQAGGELGLRIDVDELGRRTVLVTDRRLLVPDGPNYQQLVRSRPFTGVWELQTREPAQMTFGERFRRPIDDAPVDLPLREALQRAVAGAKIPLVVHTEDLVSAEISPNTIVRYEPEGREVRAVLYDLLTQADGQKSQRLIYCYQQRSDGEMTLLVTTRDAAERAGRSIPFDFSLVSDDD